MQESRSVDLPRWPRRGLYLLTPDTEDTDWLCRTVAAAIDGGACLLQYRSKIPDSALRRQQAQALLALCRSRGVPMLVNDDCDLAFALGADGVHLGEHDEALPAARARLGPEAIIGASCYDDLDLAARAAEQGASYLAFGAFHPSATKPMARRATLPLLRAASRFGLPRVAIGGIRAENARPLIEAGADLVAVITDVFESTDPAVAARNYLPLFTS